jgi:hypothetical protein
VAQTYTDVDPEVFKRNQEAAAARRSWMSAEYYTPTIGTQAQPGRNVIRLMPPHENMAGDAFIVVKMHFFPSTQIGKNGRPVPIAINCLSEYGEECDGCRHVDRLMKDAKDEDNPDQAALVTRQAKDQAAKIRAFCQIVDMDHPEKGVQRYAFPGDLENKLRMCFEDDDKNFRNITHPKTGRDVILKVWKKPGTDFNDYDAKSKESATALRDMDWLDKIEDLSELRRKPSKDDMLKAVRGERPAGALPTTAKTAETKPAPAVKQTATAKVEPKAEAPKPAPAAKTTPAATPTKRQPVVEESESVDGGDPWAPGRAACIEAGFNEFSEITPDEVEKIKKPNCFTKEAEPTDSMCQGCRVLLPCLTARLAAAA